VFFFFLRFGVVAVAADSSLPAAAARRPLWTWHAPMADPGVNCVGKNCDDDDGGLTPTLSHPGSSRINKLLERTTLRWNGCQTRAT
jgi:hypothetical protein